MTTLFSNNNRITFGSFLAYFLMSAMISPLGLVSGPIAGYFDVSITEATASFTYLTSGVFLGTLSAIFIFDFLKLRHVIIGCALAVGLSIYAIYTFENFQVFKISLLLIGASCGVELSAAAVVISSIYEERLRPSMLLLTDSFYSSAGLISTTLTGVLLARHYHWASAYLLAFCVAMSMVLIAFGSRYPRTRRDDVDPETKKPSKYWPPEVFCIGLAMLTYLIGFVCIYSWVPNFAQETLALDAETSSEIVSRFFLGMFVGQIVMFFLVMRFSLATLILVYASLSTLLTVALWTATTANMLELAMLVLGLVTGGLLKTILSYGTTLVSWVSPRMVSYLIFNAGLGTAVAPYISSWVVERGAMVSALQLATLSYLLMCIFIVAAFILRSHRSAEISHG